MIWGFLGLLDLSHSLSHPLLFEVCPQPCVGVGAQSARVVGGAREPEARGFGITPRSRLRARVLAIRVVRGLWC